MVTISGSVSAQARVNKVAIMVHHRAPVGSPQVDLEVTGFTLFTKPDGTYSYDMSLQDGRYAVVVQVGADAQFLPVESLPIEFTVVGGLLSLAERTIEVYIA